MSWWVSGVSDLVWTEKKVSWQALALFRSMVFLMEIVLYRSPHFTFLEFSFNILQPLVGFNGYGFT
jgi:hypothetical protein